MKRAQTCSRMSDRPTIILAPFDADLASEVTRRVPGVEVGGLDAMADAAGPLCLFVDWLLPETSGLELCRRLRAEPRTADARIFLVIEDDDRETRRRALKAGADDYLLGPLTAASIQARVGDAAAVSSPRAESVLAHGPLKLDRNAYQVRAGGARVPLRPSEFLLLAYFLENRDRVVSRRELIGALKGEESVDERTVDVWIGRLRRALVSARVSDPIRTVRQLGYVYDSF